jgi:hypothetical protein
MPIEQLRVAPSTTASPMIPPRHILCPLQFCPSLDSRSNRRQTHVHGMLISRSDRDHSSCPVQRLCAHASGQYERPDRCRSELGLPRGIEHRGRRFLRLRDVAVRRHARRRRLSGEQRRHRGGRQPGQRNRNQRRRGLHVRPRRRGQMHASHRPRTCTSTRFWRIARGALVRVVYSRSGRHSIVPHSVHTKWGCAEPWWLAVTASNRQM